MEGECMSATTEGQRARLAKLSAKRGQADIYETVLPLDEEGNHFYRGEFVTPGEQDAFCSDAEVDEFFELSKNTPAELKDWLNSVISLRDAPMPAF